MQIIEELRNELFLDSNRKVCELEESDSISKNRVLEASETIELEKTLDKVIKKFNLKLEDSIYKLRDKLLLVDVSYAKGYFDTLEEDSDLNETAFNVLKDALKYSKLLEYVNDIIHYQVYDALLKNKR